MTTDVLWVTVSDIHGIWTGCPTRIHHGLYKETDFRTSQLCQKQALGVQRKVCGCLGTQCQLEKSLPVCLSVNCTIVDSVCLWMFQERGSGITFRRPWKKN